MRIVYLCLFTWQHLLKLQFMAFIITPQQVYEYNLWIELQVLELRWAFGQVKGFINDLKAFTWDFLIQVELINHSDFDVLLPYWMF